MMKGYAATPIVPSVDLTRAGNVLVAGGEAMGELARTVGVLCGVDFDKKGSRVIDHFSAVRSELLGDMGGSG